MTGDRKSEFQNSDSDLPFEEWRDWLAGELAETQEALAASLESLNAAEVANATAQAAHAAISEAVTRLHGPLSYALSSRIRGVDEDRYEAAAAMTRLRAEVGHTRERVADLEQALREVGQLMAPVVVEDADAA
jgi:hypothetical protein